LKFTHMINNPIMWNKSQKWPRRLQICGWLFLITFVKILRIKVQHLLTINLTIQMTPRMKTAIQ
jgi:hypothetical protein